MAAIIETEQLGKRFGSFKALDAVDLSIPPGTIGLLGPNGAGKSTLIKCLLQLLDKDEGKARLLGMDLDEHGRETRKRIGYAPEQDCHIPGLEGCEYVTYCAQLSGLPLWAARQRAHEMLDFVGMGQERYRKVDTYSTGMKQRVKIAQALVHDPELVFLDEPTNGLDPRGQTVILQLIEKIWKEYGISVVLSSHLLQDVDRICEQIVIIAGGRILEHERLDTLKSRRKAEAELSVRSGAEKLDTLCREKGWECSRQSNGRYKLSHGKEAINGIVGELDRAGVRVAEIRASPDALNELFLKAMQANKGDAAGR